MADCLQAKIQNLHNKEILNLEKDFRSKQEFMKDKLLKEVNEEMG